jgi:hypothetical protein
LEIKKNVLVPSRENMVDEEARSCDFSRKNHELTGKCAPEHCRDEEIMSFSSTLQAFSSAFFLEEVLILLDSTIG